MAIGLLGRKIGMTRIYGEDGGSTPVTVLEIAANRVSQVKTLETDGYNAIQLSTGEKKSSRVSKSEAGHFAKAGVPAGTAVRESRVGDVAGYEPGSELTVSMFEAGQKVDVTGVSKGKGFAGVLKRYHFAGQDRTHGNSLSHRAPGSIGQNQTPGRVFPGKKMSGHLGAATRTSQNLEVVRVDTERNLLLVKGAVPGATNGDVVVKLSVKA
ncbi:MAG TPA: 50S ribosomal protein L3 [Candidatus Thiothrix moscowensis]|uniref:50S ribosomal protein L3 n=1 Tax=unclassified Thiothrix TaxID=2636184 RepID=UPI001A1D64E4|nr:MULTISPECIES: 50S ribosomal protein L3 [unclassified Thiothrix]MBJ6610383.1 50S ribosomal protein L3 [Candidatus Thiothrix moscowensis]HRJ51203.1 50S ribosomal protein L3 [Candidatus Thiothrix moscowensis]HRJ91742.1 50S ribosomal protein L3 [Candidatus Thiothrix moscowensis]